LCFIVLLITLHYDIAAGPVLFLILNPTHAERYGFMIECCQFEGPNHITVQILWISLHVCSSWGLHSLFIAPTGGNQGKVLRVHVLKPYKKRRGLAPPILNNDIIPVCTELRNY
jgi:hypothetical protein